MGCELKSRLLQESLACNCLSSELCCIQMLAACRKELADSALLATKRLSTYELPPADRTGAIPNLRPVDSGITDGKT